MQVGVITALVIPIVLIMSGCGGGGSSGGGTGSGGSSVITESVGSRIKSISFDFSQDGSVDQINTYFYDADGRVVRIESRDLERALPTTTATQYEYTDGRLVRVSESDGAEEKTFSYENDRVSVINGADGEQLTFTYNASGNLSGHTINQPYCDDFDFVATAGSTTYEYTYVGNRISAISTTDGNYNADINYNAQNRLAGLTVTDNCNGPSSEVEQITLSYDGRGLAETVEFLSMYGSDGPAVDSNDATTIVRDNLGRVASVVERDLISNSIIETRTRSYGDDGLPAMDTVVFNNQQSSFFINRDTTVTYTYEDEGCVISYTADPSRLVLLNAILPWSNFAEESALLCGYPLD